MTAAIAEKIVFRDCSDRSGRSRNDHDRWDNRVSAIALRWKPRSDRNRYDLIEFVLLHETNARGKHVERMWQ